VIAARDGFVTSEYGAGRNKTGTVITLQAGQTVSDINIALWPQGVVTGRVLDENNNPVVLASVQCMRIDYSTGRRRLAPAHGTSTNDLGEFRIFGVAPGRYVVSATYHGPQNVVRADKVILSPEEKAAESEGYLPAFYGNATSAEAAVPIDVLAGTEARGIDLHLVRTHVAHVRGIAMTYIGSPAQGAVLLWRLDSAGRSAMSPEIGRLSPPNGAFEIGNVSPGSYLLSINASDQEHAWKPIQVGDSDLDLKIVLSKPVEMKGTISVEGTTTQPAGLKVTLEATRLSGRNSVDVRLGEPFGFRGLPPDAYGVSVTGDKNDFYVKSVSLGNVDYTDSNVEVGQAAVGDLVIKLSGAAGEVVGAVESADHSPLAGITVVLVPDAPKRELSRLYKVSTTDEKGAFTMSGIAPGNYKVFAWEEVETNAWRDPEFLRPLEGLGTKVSVEENAHQSVTLQPIPKAATN